MVRMTGDRRRRHRRHTRPVVVPGDDARRRTGARLYAAYARVLVRIRADRTGRGRVGLTEDISSARSHAGAVFGVLPAPAEIVAGGRSTDVRSVLSNGAVIDSLRASHHRLPWWNTPSGGENHVSDAAGRPVYNGADAAEMFRLYTDAVQAEAEVAARRVADHPASPRPPQPPGVACGSGLSGPWVAAPPVGAAATAARTAHHRSVDAGRVGSRGLTGRRR